MTPASQSLKPDHILHELSELWTSTGRKQAGEPGASGVLRACSMTLIVLVDDESDAMALGGTILQLMRGHPSRVIVVRIRDDAGVLESRVFAQCWMPFGQRQQICCEEIEISASLDRVPDLPSIVSPLTAADVPRVLWFRSGRISQVADVGEILTLGDKMIFDSAFGGSPEFADLRVLQKAGYIIGDLAWTRLTRLRELIAQLLDGRAHQIARIEIEYDGNEAPPSVRYLQAWFRSQLPAAAVSLRRVDASAKPALKTVRIGPDTTIHAGSNCAEYEVAGMRKRAHLPECTEADLLNEELSIMTRDPIFERALERTTPWTPPC